jgi:site-specific DNA-methyltransferase (adenine-specific)
MKIAECLIGDCLEVMEVIKDESIDLICCDLPYGTTNIFWDTPIDLERLWGQYDRIIKPKGVICLFGSQPFTTILISSKIDWFKYELIWNKNKCGSPGLAKYRPMKTHENVLIFAKKSGGIYNPQMVKGEPYHRKSKNPEGYVGKTNVHGYGLKPRKEFSNPGIRYPKSILNISRNFSAQQQVHPTQKPVPLMEWLVRTYSNEGDLVLDNCMGSGSTGIAAVNLNRNFIGIEIESEYFDIAQRRIKAALHEKKGD